MNYFRHNEKRKAKRGQSPTGTLPEPLDASTVHDEARLIEVIEMEGRTIRRFRAITPDQLVTKG